MARTLADVKESVEILVQDSSTALSTANRELLIKRAVEAYSLCFPLQTVKEYAGNSIAYQFALPADFYEGFSAVLLVEYPADEQPLCFLKQDTYPQVLKKTDGLYLHFDSFTPGAYTIRIIYTTLHTVATVGGALSVPLGDFMMLCYLTAHLWLQTLANKYANTQDSSLSADVVNYRTKSDEYAARAKDWKTKFEDEVKKRGPNAAIGEWDMALDSGLLFRPREED